tara:strand:+ start:83 stop:529 length:447 start_codon:yes stop_codon:yes gene_type:complete
MNKISYKSHNHVGYCVYYLINKNEIVYIGCTFNLSKRLGEHSSWLPFNLRSKKDNKYGLCKKQFTHYFYIPYNNQKKARLLESAEIKKHKPKYNNHSDYIWVLTNRKYKMYKIFRGLDNREIHNPFPIIYKLMIWKKKKGNNRKEKNI